MYDGTKQKKCRWNVCRNVRTTLECLNWKVTTRDCSFCVKFFSLFQKELRLVRYQIIPYSITEIGMWAFSGGTDLTLMVCTNTKNLASREGVWRHRAYPSRRQTHRSPLCLLSARSPCCDRQSRRCIFHRP